MPGIETIHKWLLEKTLSSLDYRNRRIEIGPNDLRMIMDLENRDFGGPFKIVLRKRHHTDLVIHASVKSGTEPWIGVEYVKKIEYTPFFYSYIVTTSSLIHIIDYYTWGDHPELYRLFLVQQDPDPGFVLTFPENMIPVRLQDNFIQIGDFYFGLSDEAHMQWESNQLKIDPVHTTEKGWAFILKISLTTINPARFTVDQGFRQILFLSDQAAKSHVHHHMILNNSDAEKVLDDLWTIQKAIEPGWKISSSILSDPVRNGFILTWVAEIGIYFNHRDLLTDIYLALKQNFGRSVYSDRLLLLLLRLERFLNMAAEERLITSEFLMSYFINSSSGSYDPFRTCLQYAEHHFSEKPDLTEDQIIYLSFFTSGIADNITEQVLQKCWDHMSLPVFSCKLDYDLDSNPEKMVIVYLSALFQGLPFAGQLSELIEHRITDQLLQLFVFLQRWIQKRYNSGHLYRFKDGPYREQTNKKLLLIDNKLIQLNKFGKTIFTKFLSTGAIQFRIDKSVLCCINTEHKKLTIHPDVPLYREDNLTDRRVEVGVDDHALSLPLLWAKGEVHFKGLRLRWIFKKKRYQITIQKQRKEIQSLTIDNDFIDLSQRQKAIYYVEIKNSNPEIRLLALDAQGRNLHFTQRAAIRKINLVGWVKNHHNQLVEFLTYSFGKRQHLVDLSAQNHYKTSLDLPSNSKVLTIISKRQKYTLELSSIPDSFLERLFRYPASSARGHFVVLIDAEMKNQVDHIRSFFRDYFLFQPVYILSAEGRFPISSTVLIHLVSHKEGITVLTDKKITSASYLEVGMKRGIGQIHTLGDWIEEKFAKLSR